MNQEGKSLGRRRIDLALTTCTFSSSCRLLSSFLHIFFFLALAFQFTCFPSSSPIFPKSRERGRPERERERNRFVCWCRELGQYSTVPGTLGRLQWWPKAMKGSPVEASPPWTSTESSSKEERNRVPELRLLRKIPGQ